MKNAETTLKKLNAIKAGGIEVMSDAELDFLIDNDLHPDDVVSIRNPHQVGLLDAYCVAKATHPVMRVARAKQDLMTSATRSYGADTHSVWDEPRGVSTPRGWFWPKGSTRPGETLCAGHYLDYGSEHYRCDAQKETEPGSIHCVVIAKDTGRCYASRYVESVEAARAWIEQTAALAGHR